MQNAYSQTSLQKRKFLMVLPLLTLPFLTFVFWAMGGGGKEDHTGGFNSKKGLNLQLPDAKFTKEKALDKLSFYNKAQEDSIKLKQEMQNDPYYKNGLDTLQWAQSKRVPDVETFHSNKLNPSLYQSSTDINEAKIYERLSALNKVIEQPDGAMNSESNELNDYRKSFQQTDSSGDFERRENMMQAMNEKTSR